MIICFLDKNEKRFGCNCNKGALLAGMYVSDWFGKHLFDEFQEGIKFNEEVRWLDEF